VPGDVTREELERRLGEDGFILLDVRSELEFQGEAGYPCECDVHMSADREPVVLHDATLDRTTNIFGKPTDYDAADTWRCYQTARIITPGHRMLSDLARGEAAMAARYPEYF